MADTDTDTGLNLLVENLLDSVREKAKFIADNSKLQIYDLEDDFLHLEEQVQRLRALLNIAAQWQINTSSKWKQLVNKDIRITVHRAEDVIDGLALMFQLYLDKKQGLIVFDSIRGDSVRIIRRDSVSNLATKIDGLNEKVKEFLQNNQPAVQPEKNSQDLPLKENEVVGLKEEAEKVIKRLVDRSEDLNVVPVVGMHGLGKTTLAIKVFNDPQILNQFDSRIWVYVGQSYEIKDIFINILTCFTDRIEEYQDKDVNEIAKVICDFVPKEGKCLIVLDDVWAIGVVDFVKKTFPENSKGHRIMMTTHRQDVASCANPNPHDLKFLTQTESFLLLKSRVFGSGCFPEELTELGESIAQKCCGVPLAIIVIAGALRGRKDKNNWLKVQKYFWQHLIIKDDPTRCWKFVEMSYNCLPQEMKECFLYCGIFPRGFDIPAWKLIRLWIAEGLIKSSPGYALEEVAENNLNELVNRNLVIVVQKKFDSRIKTCRLHDMVQEFCKMEATRECLFHEVSLTPDQAIPDDSRRLCIRSRFLGDFLSRKPYAEHVRSFLCFSPTQLSPYLVTLLHKAFALIRVLDVEPTNFIFSRYFNVLYHLKYMAFSGDFTAIPPPFCRFLNLQTLIFNTTSKRKRYLETRWEIWNMLRLRHLHSNIPVRLPRPKTPKGEISCLRTLSMVAPESCNSCVLAKVGNLKKLSIKGNMAPFLEINKDGFSNHGELKCLENLKLLNDVFTMISVLHLPPNFFRFARTLKKLTLSDTRFDWREAIGLEQLECLEVLKLKDAFTGKSWKLEVGFSELQALSIDTTDFETWEASTHHFPRLRHLVLIYCDKLEAVPATFADIPSLREMRLENTSKAVRSAKEIERKKQEMQFLNNIEFKLTISFDVDYNEVEDLCGIVSPNIVIITIQFFPW
ncbi:putative late blight resistance protein homolog R1A-3 isoform X2 [Nicotiana tabacum]|uniref:Late blight resistance protein homolog R1A-10 isoform X1 n=1 Tax=Nicotiana tabacum TaxID=4097 RepID=A0A1S4BZL2_TOBAC|nr:PREDICTED: putative late blight resistance protein homolog R1A-10 isoform X1 [Nicotiana tabacum]